jgi:glycosyltransferase involved in cell wall biosynthesis|tara:strand:- start:21 stop:857 length:837 start_codon:yes stop_codon:yes gene_type:complete
LKRCLDSLLPQLTDQVEILVIDNGTHKVKTLVDLYSNIRYVSESNTGLSYARNKAIKEANGDWILYIDDDAKSDKNLLETTLLHCQKNQKVFGGVYYPWYYYGQPKWYKQEYGSNSKNFAASGVLPNHEFLSGGIMCIHKSVFEILGEFNTDLGMSGTKTGYGEESELQERMIKNNIPRVYDDTLVIAHVVADYKLSVDWHLQANKKRGQDMAKYQEGSRLVNCASQIAIGTLVFLKDLISYTPKLIGPNYYLENWKIDVLKKIYKRIGFISESYKST